MAQLIESVTRKSVTVIDKNVVPIGIMSLNYLFLFIFQPHVFVGDVTSEEDNKKIVDAAIAKFGKLNILVGLMVIFFKV